MITAPNFVTDAVLQAIKAHAVAEYPREACGLVVDAPAGVLYLPRANSADVPEMDFRISPQGFAGAARQGTVLAVVHSHPGGPAHPSASDMQGQLASNLPWAIVPVLESPEHSGHAMAPLWWGPGVPVDPLLEREFVHGLADCYALGRDWYRIERSITLPDFARPDSWWGKGGNLLVEHLEAAGFVRTDEPELMGDGFIMQIQSTVPNHVAVYVGGGLILHHLANRLSRMEPLHRWRSHVLYRVRLADGGKS
jgi:proteasome lid subunit RPN8/RPN11